MEKEGIKAIKRKPKKETAPRPRKIRKSNMKKETEKKEVKKKNVKRTKKQDN